MRRNRADSLSANQPEQPFLLSQPAFHPKRNQARQKLATLPTSRFRDLAGDVLFELDRRYPEFREDAAAQPSSSKSPTHQRMPSAATTSPPATANFGSRSIGPSHSRQLSTASQNTGGLPYTSSPNLSASSSAANEVLIPNKSTLVEEEVGLPATKSIPSGSRDPSSPPPNGRSGILSVLSEDDEPNPNGRSNGTYGRASEASSIATKFIGGYGSDRSGAAGPSNDEVEKIKSDYEYRLATLQQKLSTMEQSLEESDRDRTRDQNRIRDLTGDLRARGQVCQCLVLCVTFLTDVHHLL